MVWRSWWKKVDEDKVQSMYRDYMSAFDRGDAKAVCDYFHEVNGGSVIKRACFRRSNPSTKAKRAPRWTSFAMPNAS